MFFRPGHAGGVWSSAAFLALLLLPVSAQGDDTAALRMSKPVACTKVHGFGSFEELPDARLTADDKLTIYYEPSGFKTEKVSDGYRAVFSQDGRIRKKGSKDPLWKKEGMFKYEAKNKFPPYQVYLKTDISLKGLPPGEYEIDMTLHDGLDKKDLTVTKTLPFTVYVLPEPKKEPTTGDGPAK